MTTKKYYEILGISETATDSEIKKAYRKEALHWHPDKNQDRLEEANERFKLISEAYEVLKDPEQRAIYNKYGDEGFKERTSGAGAGYDSDSFHSFHFTNPEDLFREFFGGQDPFAAFFGHDPFGSHSSRRGSNTRRNDPFGGFSMFSNSFFDDDDDFFGGSGHSGFSSFSSSSFGGPTTSSFSSFSSSSFGGGMGGGNFVSTSQRTEVINGKKTIVKETRDGKGNTTVERTIIEPDGRRTQETIVNGKQQSFITDTQSRSGERLRLEDQQRSHHSNSHQHSHHSGHHSSHHSSHHSTRRSGSNNTKTSGTRAPETDQRSQFGGYHHFF